MANIRALFSFDDLAASGKRTLLLAHAADYDLRCLENVFDMPMSLFRHADECEDEKPPIFEALDTQTLFANVLGIHKSIRLCLAIWVMRLPTLGQSFSGGNFHCARESLPHCQRVKLMFCSAADCHYTFALYLRLIQALATEFGK